MPPRARPYEQFGPFILFKRLEAGALSDLWRAARIENDRLGPVVALRRLTGGDRTALTRSAAEAGAIAPLLSGTTFVKSQSVEITDGVPCVAFEYSGGRSLRHIIDRARGSTGAAPNPIPIDQAVIVAERIALSLATTAEMKQAGNRLTHGALIPQFVWVTDDGEIRLAGQQLGRGLLASLNDPKVYAEIGHYFAPERRSVDAAKASDVYSMGAILFLLVTGSEPPDPLSITAFTQAVRAAKTMSGQPVPLEIRTILDKSLTLDPSSRYPSLADMKQALDGVAAKYSATTFNLAFYLTTLLKKELEAEALEREKESKLNVVAYLAAQATAPALHVTTAQPSRRLRAPLFAAAAVVALIAIAAAAVMFMTQSNADPNPVRTAAASAPASQPPPILALPPAAETETADPEAARKAFEEAVSQKLQQEMLKLQANFNRDLQRRRTNNAPVIAEAPTPATLAPPRPAPTEERAPSAAAFDERRVTARQETATQAPAAAPAVPQRQPAAAQPEPSPPPVQQPVREGDVVDISELDAPLRLVRQPVVQYPPMAKRQKAEASVIVTALVSENGDVTEVRVLRGDPRFGFNEAAVRAVRAVKFSTPVKDGKRVKTWIPQTIYFKL